MKKIFNLMMGFTLLLTGCSIQVTKGNTYQSPSSSPQNATIVLKNKSFLQGMLGDIAYMPRNALNFDTIDGHIVGISQSDTLSISPGKHVIVISCSTDYRVVASNTIFLRAQPGRTYEISYPDDLHGYTIDYQACKRLQVR